jgi:hypothetical protein
MDPTSPNMINMLMNQQQGGNPYYNQIMSPQPQQPMGMQQGQTPGMFGGMDPAAFSLSQQNLGTPNVSPQTQNTWGY